MLEKIFGNKTAELVLLGLYHYGDLHASLLSKLSGIGETPIKNQLNRFESAGVLISKQVGRSRVYSFNPKSALIKPIKDLLAVVYENIPLSERQKMFHLRLRPRRKGKKVISNHEAT